MRKRETRRKRGAKRLGGWAGRQMSRRRGRRGKSKKSGYKM